jgi:hypothetical protein
MLGLTVAQFQPGWQARKAGRFIQDVWCEPP